jgi:4-hydroxybenzoyl-CoA reductase alpha subunit
MATEPRDEELGEAGQRNTETRYYQHDKPSDQLKVIGKPLRKVDARTKVLGQSPYADNLSMPRMVYMKLLRSTEPHARIKSIDVSAAEAMDGVVGILLGEELPNLFGILPVSRDEHTLAIDKVRFVGDPVAAVAALDEETAWEATRKIVVEYEPLPAIGSPHEAVATPEPRIHEYGDVGNVHKYINLQFGDVEKAIEDADHVREDVFYFEGNTHLPMEQHACLAYYDGDQKITIQSSTQTPHYLHKALTTVLEMPASNIRVIACPNGGGFGGKSDPFNHELAACAMSRKIGRPVKCTLTREEVFYCHRGRHPVLMKTKIGVSKDGRIKGLDFESHLDGGAFGSYGVASTFYTGALQTVTYQLDNYHFRGARYFTNKAPCGPKRGHGTVQPRFALECLLDKVACDLDLDPAAMRRKHLAERGALTANFLQIGSMGLGECIDKVVEGSAWKDRRGKMPHGKGLGIACSSYLTGAGLPIYWNSMPQSGVQLKLDRSGLVTVFCGSTDIGQGSNSILAYIVAEELGLDPMKLRIVTADTDLTPVDLGSYSSRVTLMSGNAALQAAERAKEIVASGAAAKLEVPKSRLVFADEHVFDASNPELRLSFAEAVIAAESKFGTIGTVGSYRPPRMPAKFKGGGVGPSPAYSYTAAVVEVDVDVETGQYTVPKIWVAHDIGRSINSALVMGQIEGSVYMGLGEAMMEESAYRDRSHKGKRIFLHKQPSMLDYKSPCSVDMPEIVTYIVEDPDPSGPYGAKEAGQGPLLPIMPAVANAVYDAVGVRIDTNPITPERIFAAMENKAKGKEPRFGPDSVPTAEWPEPRMVLPPWEGGDGRETEKGKDYVRKDMGESV